MAEFLEDATDFTDMELMEKPLDGYPDEPENLVLCPVCNGYGGWNLKLNAFRDGSHFRSNCSQCNGWGWVGLKDQDCVHEFEEIGPEESRKRGVRHYGMFCHVYLCRKCGQIRSYDSSG